MHILFVLALQSVLTLSCHQGECPQVTVRPLTSQVAAASEYPPTPAPFKVCINTPSKEICDSVRVVCKGVPSISWNEGEWQDIPEASESSSSVDEDNRRVHHATCASWEE